MMPPTEWDARLARLIESACTLEATAQKPGNVHPAACFADMTFHDLEQSGAVIAPVLARSAELGVGPAILQAVRLTQAAVGKNTNLGIILLLAPLAAVPQDRSLRDGIGDVLEGLTVADARAVYEALRIASPGGLGRAAEQDAANEPTVTLLEAMTLAAERDRVAWQYAHGFADVLERGVDSLISWSRQCDDPLQAIVGLHLTLMAELPDTLIARKCGADVAAESARRAGTVLQAGWPYAERGILAIANFDMWLRADGHRRNPGTTADLVAATLFAARRDGKWDPLLQ